MPELRDVIDRIVGQWNRELPGLDVSATHVIQRITRLYLLQTASFATLFARYGLTFGEWEVLAILRRSGPPHELKPTEVYSELVLSSGALTNRLNRLEAAGLIQRRPDPGDRRGTLVGLTREGMRVCDAAHLDHLANEERLLAGLTAAERERLTRLLRKLLVSPAFHALDPARAPREVRRGAPGGAAVPAPVMGEPPTRPRTRIRWRR